MKTRKAYISIVYYLIVFLSFIVGTTMVFLTILVSYSNPHMCQTIARRWARFLLTFSGVKITVSGLENIPKNQPVIFASNHQGAADILLCLGLIPINFRFVIKKELFKIPLFGWILKKCDYFVIDRASLLSVLKMTQDFVGVLEKGGSILIFPEGTRSRNGALGPFKQASLLAAPKAGVPVVPIAISGSYSILQRGSWVFERHPIKFSVGKPIKIASEDEYVKKLEEIRAAIARML